MNTEIEKKMRSRNKMEKVEKILIDYIKEKYTKDDKNFIEIEEMAKKIKDKIFSTTQLRLLLSNSVIVKNKISSKILKKKDKLSDALLNDVKYLLIKHTYQCGREFKVKEFDKKFEISERLRKIKTKEDFDRFYRYLEEIVAYVKYYIG